MEKTESIHPRVSGGRTRFNKENTSKKKSAGTLAKAIAAIEKHLEEHPNNAVAKGHLTKLKAQL